MITVLPASKERTDKALAGMGLTDGVCLTMSDGQREIGYTVYTLIGKTARLYVLESEEGELIELLVRAALNSALLRGAEKMTVLNPDLLPKIAPFAFDQTDDGAEVEIDAFFNRSCPSGGCGGCSGCGGK